MVMVETWALEFSRKPILVTLCAKNKQIEELRRWSMRQNELMKKEKKHSMIERSSFTPQDNRTSKINEAEKNK